MREQVEQHIANAVESVESGHMDALKCYIELKRVQNLVGDAMKQIQDAAIEELDNYPKRKAEAFGAVAEVRNSAGRWSFNGLSDWKELKGKLKAIEDEAKSAYKASIKGQELYDEDGVKIEPAEYTEGKETIFIKL